MKPESSESPRVLVVSLVFPPTGGSGVQRTAKFVKYLPQFGWEPCVWSARRIRVLPMDRTLMRDVHAELRREQRSTIEWLWGLQEFENWTGSLGTKRLSGRILNGISWRLNRVGITVARWMVPDEYTGWVLRSILPALAYIRREKIKVLYSTMSPPANHYLAFLLHKITGLPWVADYRDPWIDFYHYDPVTRYHDRLFRRLDRAFLKNATQVVAATPGVAEMLAPQVDLCETGKITVIRNGVDLDDVQRQEKALSAFRNNNGSEREFRITCVGKIEPSLIPPELREGISRFVESATAENIRVKLRFVGLVSDEVRHWLESLGDHVEMPGYVDHDRAVREMLEADLLLFGIAKQEGGDQAIVSEGGKLFEYLGSGRPIFYAGPDRAEAKAIIHQCQAGWCTSLEPDQIAGTLHYIASQWNHGVALPGCSPEMLEPFTRRHVSGQLAEVLYKAAGIPCDSGGLLSLPEQKESTPEIEWGTVEDTPGFVART